MSERGNRLSADSVSLAYGEISVVEELSLRLPDGRITTIIGPNACGKSTLLRSLARLHRPKHGAVYLDGHAIHRLPTKEVARRVGLLSQQSNAPEGLTVEDLVRRGRYPHQGFFQPPSRADHEAVERALELAGVDSLRDRVLDELSGGQRQRAWIAMALAQDTSVLLLDEPTTYLDIAHQQEVLALVRKLNRQEGRTIVMVLHDINEAAAVSDRIVAMRGGRIVADGPPEEVVSVELLSKVFGVHCDIANHPDDARPIALPRGDFCQPPSSNTQQRPAFDATALTLGYGRQPVVEDLSLAVPAGKVTVIIGPNACGKSTLLRALGRLHAPTGGEVTLDGRPISNFRARKFAQLVAVLPQSPLPPPDIILEDLVAAGRYPHQRWYRQWSREDARAVAEAMDATATTELRLRAVEGLSGGQRQRAFLAMTLAREAQVLLLDEPTTFLDIAHQVEVLDLAMAANRERGATVVMVLHDLALACRYADHLIAMRDGRVIAAGAPGDVVTRGLGLELFDIDCAVVADPLTGRPLLVPAFHSESASEPVAVAVPAGVGGTPVPEATQ